MARHRIDVGGGKPWLDIGSYGRSGRGRRDRLSPAQVESIRCTVGRTPEVMVKMLNQGGQGTGAVTRHFRYLDRDGDLPIHTDEGEELAGAKASAALIKDWDLDLEENRPATADHKPRERAKPPKLVHKILFSMPAGTPAEKVLKAVKTFAREEFGAKHRYAMVLHTDEPHPHVHLVVKAMGRDGKRLNIRRATLRGWRQQFAKHLREQGVAANATDRQIRGVSKPQKPDGIYRAASRGASTHWEQRARDVARPIARGENKPEPVKAQLLATRRDVVQGWSAVGDDLERQGYPELALAVKRFAWQLPPVRTEKEWIREQMQQQRRVREQDRTR